MALTGDTGNLATATLPGSYSVALMTIDPGAESIPMIPVSVLATTSTEEKIPGDLTNWEKVTCTFKFVGSVAKPTLGTVGTCTFTQPLTGALTNAATLSGTGCITRWKPPRLENNVLQIGEFDVEFDGDTGPTYTVAS